MLFFDNDDLIVYLEFRRDCFDSEKHFFGENKELGKDFYDVDVS